MFGYKSSTGFLKSEAIDKQYIVDMTFNKDEGSTTSLSTVTLIVSDIELSINENKPETGLL
jgi:hypothetical protein